MGGGMRHPAGLAWLPLATCDEAEAATMTAVSHAVTAIPEFRRDPMVDHVPQHVGALAVLDQPEGITAELEVIAPLIDAVGAVAFDVDAPFHFCKKIAHRGRAGLQADIGDAYDRDAAPTIRPV